MKRGYTRILATFGRLSKFILICSAGSLLLAALLYLYNYATNIAAASSVIGVLGFASTLLVKQYYYGRLVEDLWRLRNRSPDTSQCIQEVRRSGAETSRSVQTIIQDYLPQDNTRENRKLLSEIRAAFAGIPAGWVTTIEDSLTLSPDDVVFLGTEQTYEKLSATLKLTHPNTLKHIDVNNQNLLNATRKSAAWKTLLIESDVAVTEAFTSNVISAHMLRWLPADAHVYLLEALQPELDWKLVEAIEQASGIHIAKLAASGRISRLGIFVDRGAN